MTLYAVYYLLENESNWRYYGAFTTHEMAKDLENHIIRSHGKPYKDIVNTKIVVFKEA